MENLPTESVLLIVSFLDTISILNVEKTSKAMHSVCALVWQIKYRDMLTQLQIPLETKLEYDSMYKVGALVLDKHRESTMCIHNTEELLDFLSQICPLRIYLQQAPDHKPVFMLVPTVKNNGYLSYSSECQETVYKFPNVLLQTLKGGTFKQGWDEFVTDLGEKLCDIIPERFRRNLPRGSWKVGEMDIRHIVPARTLMRKRILDEMLQDKRLRMKKECI